MKILLVAPLLFLLAPLSVGQSNLQELIDATPDGGVLELEAGRAYKSDSEIWIVGRKGLTLRGGKGTEIVCTQGSPDVIVITDSADITLEGITAYHEEQPGGCGGGVVAIFTSHDIRVEDCDLNGSGAIGVYARESRNLTVKHNKIHNNSFTAFFLHQCTKVRFTENEFYENESDSRVQSTTSFYAIGNTLDGKPWTPDEADPLPSEIQRLIEEAPDGAVIELEPRRYDLNAGLVIDRCVGLTLRGQTGTSLVCKRQNEPAILVSNSEGVALEGLRFLREPAGGKYAAPILNLLDSRDLKLVGCDLPDVVAKGVHGLVVEGNEIRSPHGRGLELSDCKDVNIVRNGFHGTLSIYRLDGEQVPQSSENTLDGLPWRRVQAPIAQAPLVQQFIAYDRQSLQEIPSSATSIALYWFHDDWLALLSRFERLEELLLVADTETTGSQFAKLGRLPNLRRLTVVGDSGLRSRSAGQQLGTLGNIEELHLQASFLDRAVFGGEFLAGLCAGNAPLPNLRVLTLDDTGQDAPASELGKLSRAANLRELVLVDLPFDSVQGSWFRELSTTNQLRVLRLHVSDEPWRDSWQLNPAAAASLGLLTRMEVLEIEGVFFEEDTDLQFLNRMSELRELRFLLARGGSGLDQRAYKGLARNQKLESVLIQGTSTYSMDGASADALWSIPNLKSAAIDFAPPPDALLRMPRHVKSLRVEALLDREQWIAMAALAREAQLDTLDLEGLDEPIPAEFFQSIRLRELIFEDQDLAGIPWATFGTNTTVQVLRLKQCPSLDPAGLAQFKRLNPTCAVFLED